MNTKAKHKTAQAKHTPGPWFVTRGNEIGHDYKDLNGNRHVGYVAETLHRGKQGEANARLIAAAPTMLQALKDLTAQIQLGKLNIRKDFSLMNAHAAATKAIFQAEKGE